MVNFELVDGMSVTVELPICHGTKNIIECYTAYHFSIDKLQMASDNSGGSYQSVVVHFIDH